MLKEFSLLNFNDISELKENHYKTIKKYDSISKELEYIDSDLIKKNGFLQKIRRELALSEKNVKDIENDIFKMKKIQLNIDEAKEKIINDIETKEKKIEELKLAKDNTEESINDAEKSIELALKESVDLKHEHKILFDQFSKLNTEMESLSKNIDKCLSNTSYTREGMELEMENLNVTFVSAIEEQQNLAQNFLDPKNNSEKLQKIIEELREEKKIIEEEKKIIEEEKKIKKEVYENKKEFMAAAANLNDLTAQNKSKTEEFDNLNNENIKLKNMIKPLLKETKKFEQYMAKFKEAQKIKDNSKKSLKDNFEKLKEMLIYNAIMEEFTTMEKQYATT